MRNCPHCQQALPKKLVWKSLFAGQVPHDCPSCGQPFRLTFRSKMRISYLNVTLILGFIVLWNIPDVLRNLAVFAVVAAIVIAVLPSQARYEKTTEPDH